MSAGVRKGAKCVGDCGWLFLGRWVFKKRSLHSWSIGEWMACMCGTCRLFRWKSRIKTVGKNCRFWEWVERLGEKGRSGGGKMLSLSRSLSLSLHLSISPSLSVLTMYVAFIIFSTYYHSTSLCHRIHVRPNKYMIVKGRIMSWHKLLLIFTVLAGCTQRGVVWQVLDPNYNNDTHPYIPTYIIILKNYRFCLCVHTHEYLAEAYVTLCG